MAEEQQQGGSFLTVVIALAANVLIAIAKSVAALLTTSASMTAEAAHSWADSGNEVLLLIAERRGRRGPDRTHPYGYGKDVYVWSLFAAFGLFTVGAVVSVIRGISELASNEPAEDPLVAYVVLAVAFVLEGTSFLRSVKQLRGTAAQAEQDVLEHVLATSDPTVRAVFFEDAAALIGLVLAAAGIVLHEVTGSAVWDAIGSIAIGVLLGVVAVILIQLNRRFLIGQSPSPRVMRAVLRLLAEQRDVASVSYLHLEYVGPARVFLVAAVDLVGDAPEHEIAERLAALGRAVEQDEHVVEAVLTLSQPGAPVLQVRDEPVSAELPR
ncbi:cation diffusion facilitator family transporter [Amnibacterium kyonggiense]|uniref:Cation diffusion facilitator family transporter n=1 Tax=Amnibacterium kyonggiense TaxID=595671 RepID=A0A4R7FMB6_9MICO|nr:cation diffusion facilitator family transporter [Amnibacterium kyonggiense]TDS77468.1 cation diffusion facilitator family transporter [Amnibacterium kyonggiense]